MSQMLTESEAARYVAMSRSWLRKSRCNGRRETWTEPIPFYRLGGGAIRYSIEDLDKWLDARRIEP